MSLSLFWQGTLVGLSIAAPIGPMCIFCLRKSVNEGLLVGLAIALGIATADAVYAFVASQGIAALAVFLHEHAIPLKILGSLIIAYLGYSALTNIPPERISESCPTSTLYKTYASAVALTLASPMTIALFMAFFTRLEADAFSEWNGTFALIGGVTFGALIWFSGLSALVHIFRSWFTAKRLYYINIASGIILLGFAAIGLLSVVF